MSDTGRLKPILDPDFYDPETRKRVYLPKPRAEANIPAAKTSIVAPYSAVRPTPAALRAAARIIDAVTAAGVTVRENAYFTPLHDADVPQEHQATLAKYRKLASEHGVPDRVDVCYRVRSGFTLKQHAYASGPCHENFVYLRNWSFADTPTPNCYVFWIPCLVPGSTLKTKDEQLRLLAEIRTRLELPSHHLTSFGSAALLAGLILAHQKATGERIPFAGYWVRTDTCSADGLRLALRWSGGELYCGAWYWDDGRRVGLGGVALGVSARDGLALG